MKPTSTPGRAGARRAAEVHHARGAETRQRILAAAFALATREGLEAATIGRLAEATQLSKAGLFAHFGSKEELQIAIVGWARALFVDQVVRPALQAEAGVPRLLALYARWLGYSFGLDGGCFFVSASIEFDARPGAVRDHIAAVMREWLEALERAVAEAQRRGHVLASVEPAQVAFELNALAMASNWARQLFGDPRAGERARHALSERLRGIVTAEGERHFRRALRAAARDDRAPTAQPRRSSHRNQGGPHGLVPRT